MNKAQYRIIKINPENFGPVEELCKLLTEERGSDVKPPAAVLEAVKHLLEARKQTA